MSEKAKIQMLVKAADVGTDSAFQALLTRYKHLPDRVAPANLRAFLQQFQIVRFEFGMAFKHAPDALELTWWMGELGVRGEVGATRESVMKLLREAGLASQPKGNPSKRPDVTTYAGATGPVETDVDIRGPHRWVGGREVTCGMQVYWHARSRETAQRPTLSDIIAALPVLKDARVDARVYADLGAERVEHLAAGGTWNRYYDWDCTFAPADAPTFRARVEQLLTELRYAQSEKDKKYDTWERRSTGSFAWVYPPGEGGNLKFRIQPES